VRSYHIAKTKADQEAEVKRIAQQQDNQSKILAAEAAASALRTSVEAELAAASKRAEIKLIEAKAEAEATVHSRCRCACPPLRATGLIGRGSRAQLLKAKAQQEAAELQAAILEKYPAALRARVAELQSQAIAKATMIVGE
jgi:hypothetical protein